MQDAMKLIPDSRDELLSASSRESRQRCHKNTKDNKVSLAASTELSKWAKCLSFFPLDLGFNSSQVGEGRLKARHRTLEEARFLLFLPT